MRFPATALAFLLVAAALLTPARARTLAEIPFQYRDGFLWLKVHVAGHAEPLDFLLDSGAASTVLDAAAARRLDLKPGRPQAVQGVQSRATASRIDGFQAKIAGIALPKSVLTVDLRAISGARHLPIAGLLGADFLRNRIVQIDFAACRIRLLDETHPSPQAAILPLKIRNAALCVPVRIAGNPPQWVRLDTGCDSALEWAAGLAGAPRTRDKSIALASAPPRGMQTDVQLGNHSVSRVRVGLHDRQIFSGEAGLLGNALLRQFRVTIDTTNRRLILE